MAKYDEYPSVEQTLAEPAPVNGKTAYQPLLTPEDSARFERQIALRAREALNRISPEAVAREVNREIDSMVRRSIKRAIIYGGRD